MLSLSHLVCARARASNLISRSMKVSAGLPHGETVTIFRGALHLLGVQLPVVFFSSAVSGTAVTSEVKDIAGSSESNAKQHEALIAWLFPLMLVVMATVIATIVKVCMDWAMQSWRRRGAARRAQSLLANEGSLLVVVADVEPRAQDEIGHV